MTIKNRFPLAVSYDSNNDPSGLAEFEPKTTDLSDIGDSTPSTGQVLTWTDDGKYQPQTPTGGGGELANVDQNSVMITNSVSSASSVSGASGTLVYFEGTPPAPGLQTINTILTNAGINFESPSYMLAIASGSHSIADETSAAIGWSTTGTGAITDPAGNIAIDASGSIVNIGANGVYQIDCSVRGTGNNGRLGLVLGIHINPAGDGFTESIVHQTAQYASRGNTGELIEEGNVYMNTLVSLNSGDKIAFYVKVLAFVSPSTILQNGTYLRITKVG